MAAANQQPALTAALAALETGVTKPVHKTLGVTASPQAAVDHLNDRLAAQGIYGERVEYAVERIDGVMIPAGHGYRYGGKVETLAMAAE